MNCRSCLHARRAGNKEMIGCQYWTAIYHGDKNILTLALKEIIKRKNLAMDLDSEMPGRECVGVLIDTLITEYAPKPIFQGWVDLENPICTGNLISEMTNFCVVLDPSRLCSLLCSTGRKYSVIIVYLSFKPSTNHPI